MIGGKSLPVWVLAVALMAFPSIGSAQDLSPKAREYMALAEKYKPTGRSQAAVEKYMAMNKAEREAAKKQGSRSPLLLGALTWLAMEYGAYALCFYSGLAGSDLSSEAIVEIGDDCAGQYIN